MAFLKVTESGASSAQSLTLIDGMFELHMGGNGR